MPRRTSVPAPAVRGIVAGVLAVLLVGAGAFFLLTSNSNEQSPLSTPTPTVSPTPTPTPTPEREPTVAAAVTVHPEATRAAMEVLDDGGTAADAAVTVAAVLSVVEPHFSNVIAGETSALFHDGETGEVQSLEGVGTVGSEFDLGAYQARGAEAFGLHQSLVPGSWDGWMRLLHAEGELELERLLRPAITLARDGHAATAETASRAASSLWNGGMNGPAQAIYAPGGTPISAGDTVVQSDFAQTLQSLADVATAAEDREVGIADARAYAYTGELGERILAAAREGGATFTSDDMAAYESKIGEPIALEYAGHTVYQNPPTSQGITMLTALNTLRSADLSAADTDTVATAHTMIEAMKLAMADREAYVGDPAFTEVPVDEMLDPAYGEQQLARIDGGSAASWPIAPGLGEDTTTYQIVDEDGNALAVTTSTGYQFMTAGDTGVMMNNRMRYMTAADPDSPNFLEPGKRVRYTGNPYMVTGDSGVRLLGGNIGADTQSQAQMQQVVGVLNFGLSASESIARHRFVTKSHPDSVVPHPATNTVLIEDSAPGAVIEGLRQRGQNLDVQPAGSLSFGYGTMIELINGGQSVELGLDPRVDTSTGDTREPG